MYVLIIISQHPIAVHKNVNVWIDAEQTFRISAGKQDEKKT